MKKIGTPQIRGVLFAINKRDSKFFWLVSGKIKNARKVAKISL